MAMERNATADGNRTEYHKFVLANVDSNNNKFWNVGLFDSDDVHIEFGRVGVTSTKGVHRGVGRRKMDALIKSKEKKGYRELDTLDGFSGSNSNTKSKAVASSQLKKVAAEQIEHTSQETKDLIHWLADVNRHQIYDATGGQVTFNNDTGLFQTPMGIVTPSSISEARKLLIVIGDYVADRDWDNTKMRRTVSDYLMLVPQNVGMKLRVHSLLPDLSAVQKQNDILDALDASYVQATSTPQDDKKKVDEPKVFETKLDIVTATRIVNRINKLYKSTINSSHSRVSGLKIKKIWAVEISTVAQAFAQTCKRIDNIMELWHGTSCSNLLSILKGGLVIPPSSSSHVTGRLYGNGVYGSDQSTKALNYATSFWGQKDYGRYFMFLCRFAMGKAHMATRYGTSCYPKRGYDSTFAKGGQSQVLNNEMIVYNTNQVNLDYLVEFGR